MRGRGATLTPGSVVGGRAGSFRARLDVSVVRGAENVSPCLDAWLSACDAHPSRSRCPLSADAPPATRVDTPRPTDLIPVKDAARTVDRSLSTVRAWIRNGEITGYREDPAHPENSPVLVSRAELLHVAGLSKSPTPGRARSTVVAPAVAPPVGPAPVPPDVLAMVDTAHRGTIAALEARCRDLERTADEWRARALGAEAERDALRVSAGIPWWRRLLPG